MSAETDALLNNLATAPAAVAALFVLATATLFGVGSAWYKSYLGVAFFGFFLSVIPVFGIVVFTRLITALTVGTVPTSGDGYGVVRFVFYSFAALASIAMFIILILERRGRPMLRIPFRKTRRKAEHRGSQRSV